jgi:hypothetical protein
VKKEKERGDRAWQGGECHVKWPEWPFSSSCATYVLYRTLYSGISHISRILPGEE